MSTETNGALTMDRLDQPTSALVRLAVAIAGGNPVAVTERVDHALAAEVPPVWIDELMLQSILMVGYPRALGALGEWRRREGRVASLEDGADFDRVGVWKERGEGVCRTVYGANYDKLRDNVRALHPAVDAWMVIEGYGRTLGRPGLDLARRELCVVGQVAALGAERQLHSHLRGALNAGVAPAAIDQVLDLIEPDLDPSCAEMARSLWGKVSS